MIRDCRLGHWKNIWVGVARVKVSGCRGHYGEMLGINPARLVGINDDSLVGDKLRL